MIPRVGGPAPGGCGTARCAPARCCRAAAAMPTAPAPLAAPSTPRSTLRHGRPAAPTGTGALRRHVAVAAAAPRALDGFERRSVAAQAVKSGKRLKYSAMGQKRSGGSPKVVSIAEGEEWRCAEVADMLAAGGIGIIPTDTLPAIVADLHNRTAALRLAAVKEMSPKKPLSILCRNFQDIAHYTNGFPVSNEPGARDWFKVLKRLLPGPYTLILSASKNLPTQIVDDLKGKSVHRKSVGVRIPDDSICQAVLEGLGRPVLATSVHVGEHLSPDTEVPDLGQMLDLYGGSGGIDFIIDVGRRFATESTVVDMTGEVEVVRVGRGDPSPFED